METVRSSFPSTSAFPRFSAGQLLHHPFRGLHSVHDCYGLQTRQVACATLYTRGFSSFVTSTTAPIATGWSEPVPGRDIPRCGPAPFHGAREMRARHYSPKWFPGVLTHLRFSAFAASDQYENPKRGCCRGIGPRLEADDAAPSRSGSTLYPATTQCLPSSAGNSGACYAGRRLPAIAASSRARMLFTSATICSSGVAGCVGVSLAGGAAGVCDPAAPS
jgi:hypothetical protein